MVVDFAESKATKSGKRLGRYKVRCDCGTEFEVKTKHLTSGATCSCGCYAREKVSQIAGTHRKSTERIYNVWTAMKQRCYNPNCDDYINYGGRGITVCDEWRNDFQTFYDWAYANGYAEEILPNGYNLLSIDRIDVNGNYEPSNCRWITNKEQQWNKRPKRLFTINGIDKTLPEWCRTNNIGYQTVVNRIKRGWDTKTAVLTPPIAKKMD